MENCKNITQLDYNMKVSGVFWSQYLIYLNIEMDLQCSKFKRFTSIYTMKSNSSFPLASQPPCSLLQRQPQSTVSWISSKRIIRPYPFTYFVTESLVSSY